MKTPGYNIFLSIIKDKFTMKGMLLVSASSSDMQQLQSVPACKNILHKLVPASSNSGLQQYLPAPAPAAAPLTNSSSSPVVSPRMTRARKKRKAASSASPVECAEIDLVDGLGPSPPPSPEELRSHRVITVIEELRLVVLGSTALFTKVGQLHIQIIGKRGGEISYLYRQKKGRGIRASGRTRTYNLHHGPVFLEKKKTAETTQPQAII